MTFTITSLKVQTPVNTVTGRVIDPDWSWTAPDGRVVRWAGGAMLNADEQSFEGVDEDGCDTYDHYWTVEGTDIRVPEPDTIEKTMRYPGHTTIEGTFTADKPPAMDEKFESGFHGKIVTGVLITACNGATGHPWTGSFVADAVLP